MFVDNNTLISAKNYIEEVEKTRKELLETHAGLINFACAKLINNFAEQMNLSKMLDKPKAFNFKILEKLEIKRAQKLSFNECLICSSEIRRRVVNLIKEKGWYTQDYSDEVYHPKKWKFFEDKSEIILEITIEVSAYP